MPWFVWGVVGAFPGGDKPLPYGHTLGYHRSGGVYPRPILARAHQILYHRIMPGPEPRRRNIRLAPEVYAKIGAIALLTTCTTDRKSIFNNPKFADLVLSEISLLHGVDSRVLGFCVMPDHVHLLILNIKGSFLDFMRIFKGRIARELRGQGQSRIWQRSFHDHLLRRNEDISGTLRYLLENPVRAGLVDSWTDYRWCGSLQWPEIDHRFFTVNPASIIWSEVTAEDSGRG